MPPDNRSLETHEKKKGEIGMVLWCCWCCLFELSAATGATRPGDRFANGGAVGVAGGVLPILVQYGERSK